MLNTNEIKEIIQLIESSSSIQEFTLKQGVTELAFKKKGSETVQPAHAAVQNTVISEPFLTTAPKQEAPTLSEVTIPTPAPAVDTDTVEVVSPMVGTFYSSASPDTPEFVKKGDTVRNDTVVCIVEAMKLFNEIEAEAEGEIVEVLVQNGQLVEFGQPLFKVRPTGGR